MQKMRFDLERVDQNLGAAAGIILCGQVVGLRIVGDYKSVSATVLGVVHRLLGAFDQAIRIFSMIAVKSNAYAGRECRLAVSAGRAR
jgi:hypothetical protein